MLLEWMYGVIMKDERRNKFIREQPGIAPIEDKMRKC